MAKDPCKAPLWPLLAALAVLVGGWLSLRGVDRDSPELEATAEAAEQALSAMPAEGSPTPAPSDAGVKTGEAKAAAPVAPPVPAAMAVARSRARPEVSALRAAFEREAPDAMAAQEEAAIRAIYADTPRSNDFFRSVRCTRSVCRLELRWSAAVSAAYNDALVKIVKRTTRTVSFEPEHDPGSPTGVFPLSVFVARPGHSVESLLAAEAETVAAP